VLISHVHKFIYLKTRKTGGTSVEIYFERHCLDPALPYQELHGRDQEVSKWGIIGARGAGANTRTWYNHMRASRIRDLMGPTLWNEYYKFCVVRNPFDKVVSRFWFDLAPARRAELKSAGFATVRSSFAEWLPTAELPDDKRVLSIHAEPVATRLIRYESLAAGIEQVCKDLSLAWEPARLGRYKSDSRLRDEHFSDYYDPATAQQVQERLRWEIEYSGYPIQI
jgi:hypothetical protein